MTLSPFNEWDFSYNPNVDTCVVVNTTETNPVAISVGTSKTMSDVVIPNFNARSARGEVFVNPMSKVETGYDVTPGTASYTIPKLVDDNCDYSSHRPASLWCIATHFDGIPYSVGVPADIAFQQLSTIAGTQAAAGIKEPEFDGLVSLGEMRETLRFLLNPLGATVSYLKDIRRKKRKSRFEKAKRLGEYLSDNWLGYRYGIRPMVMDIRNALEAVEAAKSPRPERFTSRGTASQSSVFDTYDVPEASTDVTFGVSSRGNINVSVRAGVLYAVSTDFGHYGFSIEEFPSAVWELIPFSFVADWFGNIGSYVSAITPRSGVHVLGSWTTTRIAIAGQREVWVSDGGSIPNVDEPGERRYRNFSSDGKTQEFYESLSTSRVPGLDVGLTTKPGVFAGDIGQKRVVDAVALIESVLRSR